VYIPIIIIMNLYRNVPEKLLQGILSGKITANNVEGQHLDVRGVASG
jgi:hypothetical protein